MKPISEKIVERNPHEIVRSHIFGGLGIHTGFPKVSCHT